MNFSEICVVLASFRHSTLTVSMFDRTILLSMYQSQNLFFSITEPSNCFFSTPFLQLGTLTAASNFNLKHHEHGIMVDGHCLSVERTTNEHGEITMKFTYLVNTRLKSLTLLLTYKNHR